MDISAGVQGDLILIDLFLIIVLLAMAVYRLRRIYEVLTAAPPLEEVRPLRTYPYPDPDLHSPFSGN